MRPFTATLNDRPLHNFKTNKVQALLIYLAVEHNPEHREALWETARLILSNWSAET